MVRVALRDIHKRFGATQALRGAELELADGEVHALLGENGAGKTTLVETLYGSVRPDAGEIQLDGRPVRIQSPRHALDLGIALVHQHSMLVPALTVTENLRLGGAVPDRAAAVALLAGYELELPPDRPVADLAVAELQRLEIIKALARGARVLILDEPTAVLTPSEVAELLGLLDRLRAEGRSVLFISHKLAEITSICDRVTVLRAGRTVATRSVAGLDASTLGRLMLGDDPPLPGRPVAAEPGPIGLRARALRAPGLNGLDLEIHAGEVLALAGIEGNGQRPLEAVLGGVEPLVSGELTLERPPLALVTGDRQRTGLVLGLSVEENLILREASEAGRKPLFRCGLLQRRALRAHALACLERFSMSSAPDAKAAELSGGNQQKLCIARALRGDVGVLVLVNPTRGLDVSSAAAVRDEIRLQVRAGVAVLLVSTDLDEVLELADRIAVLFRGTVTPAPSRDRSEIGRLMLGETG